jgi:hypothetical protein
LIQRVHDLLEMTKIAEALQQHLSRLPLEHQQRVLQFAEALLRSLDRGVPGDRLVQFAGTVTPDDAREMAQEIERGCEQVIADEW